ncbi:MAG: winged helix-turn-helix domain-containing protein [Candidatus Hodarchaeales archaeon]|jgi:predicted transcriptional regulator
MTNKEVVKEIKNSGIDQEKETFKFLMKNELRYGIVTSIRIYGALNLKKISELLDKSETTLISHVKDLLNEGFITHDKETKRKERGKFYINSPKTQSMYQSFFQELGDIDFDAEIDRLRSLTDQEFQEYVKNKIKKEFKHDLEPFFQTVKAGAVINSNVAKFAMKDFY